MLRRGRGEPSLDTATEVTAAVGIAVAGTILALLFTGNVATSGWTAQAEDLSGAARMLAAASWTLVILKPAELRTALREHAQVLLQTSNR